MEYRHALIESAIQAGDQVDLDAFWKRIDEAGTPLVESISGTDESWVTFVYRLDDEDSYAVLSGIATLPADTVLSRIDGTDIAYLAVRMKNDRRVSYTFVPDLPLIDPQNCTSEENESFRSHLQAHPPAPDPYSRVKLSVKNPDGTPSFMSVLELPDAPDQSICKKRDGIVRGYLENHELESRLLGNSRLVTVYTPPRYDRASRYPLLVVFDGGAYLTRIPGHRILDNLITDGTIPPVVAAFVNPATDRPDARTHELMLGDDYVEFVAGELVAWMVDNYGASTAPGQNVLAGSSAGGVCSAYVAFKRPDVFGNVLSQSGAYWVGPGYRQSLLINGDFERQWLISRFEEKPRLPLRFYLDVGQYESEDTMLSSNRRFKAVLEAKGYPLFYQEFAGGHDYACWRGTFADGLRFLLGISIETFHPSQWREYRDLRLRALKDSPDAFSSTFERESASSDADWQRRLNTASAAFDLPLCARVDGKMAGLAWVRILEPDDRHAHLFQMWVAPEARGRGVGRRLLDAALAWAEGRKMDALLLDVTEGDTPARGLYESAGFVATGEQEPLRPGSALRVQRMIYRVKEKR